MGELRDGAEVDQGAIEARVPDDDARGVVADRLCEGADVRRSVFADVDLSVSPAGGTAEVSIDHSPVVRMHAAAADDPVAFGQASGHLAGFRGRARAVVEARVGEWQPEDLADDRLE